jgi:hypothetical protein
MLEAIVALIKLTTEKMHVLRVKRFAYKSHLLVEDAWENIEGSQLYKDTTSLKSYISSPLS